MEVVNAPRSYAESLRPWLFLAGSIEQGKAEDWQVRAVRLLHDARFDGTILNPRRDEWDDTWQQSIDNALFREQVEWELAAQEQADAVLMYFARETRSPITLLELGLAARTGRLVVACPAGFWRKGNVDIVCRRYAVPLVESLEDAVSLLVSRFVGS